MMGMILFFVAQFSFMNIGMKEKTTVHSMKDLCPLLYYSLIIVFYDNIISSANISGVYLFQF